ncbi:hypothetical protein PVAP13_2NG114146 [Panicum virgatum]|uniref:Uncharacterized protein n=1 Tax=Panicum virgatum TaxID=38727 RepID=A0A8T0VG37_PANVG|nr:hypothetical protein PVAP13_2NG114146 [Panicum virgatum]
MELSLTGNSQSALPPPLRTLLLLSARRGVRHWRISPSPAAYPPLRSVRTAASGAAEAGGAARVARMAMGGAEQHAAAGKRSSAGGLSGAHGRRAGTEARRVSVRVAGEQIRIGSRIQYSRK